MSILGRQLIPLFYPTGNRVSQQFASSFQETEKLVRKGNFANCFPKDVLLIVDPIGCGYQTLVSIRIACTACNKKRKEKKNTKIAAFHFTPSTASHSVDLVNFGNVHF